MRSRSDVTTFGTETLRAFEDAAASIVLRGIERAFERAGIRPVDDAGDGGGARRIHFRRYVAGVDQRDPDARDRLGVALGALIADVAASKVAFLVGAAERDGFAFADGAFRVASTASSSFTIARVEEFGSLDERVRRLRLLASERPAEAVAGAIALFDSTCRTLLQHCGASPLAGTPGLGGLATATLASLDAGSAGVVAAERAELASSIARLCAVVARLAESGARVTARHARLAVDAVVALTGYLVETYLARSSFDDEPVAEPRVVDP